MNVGQFIKKHRKISGLMFGVFLGTAAAMLFVLLVLVFLGTAAAMLFVSLVLVHLVLVVTVLS